MRLTLNPFYTLRKVTYFKPFLQVKEGNKENTKLADRSVLCNCWIMFSLD